MVSRAGPAIFSPPGAARARSGNNRAQIEPSPRRSDDRAPGAHRSAVWHSRLRTQLAPSTVWAADWALCHPDQHGAGLPGLERGSVERNAALSDALPRGTRPVIVPACRGLPPGQVDSGDHRRDGFSRVPGPPPGRRNMLVGHASEARPQTNAGPSQERRRLRLRSGHARVGWYERDGPARQRGVVALRDRARPRCFAASAPGASRQGLIGTAQQSRDLVRAARAAQGSGSGTIGESWSARALVEASRKESEARICSTTLKTLGNGRPNMQAA